MVESSSLISHIKIYLPFASLTCLRTSSGLVPTERYKPAFPNLPGYLTGSEDVTSPIWGPGNCRKSPRVLLTSPAHSCLKLTDTYAHTHREKKATCQRSPFILHVSRNDEELADRGASERGERVTGSEHSLVWKWLKKTRTIRSNPTMLSMFRGTRWHTGPGTMLVSVKFRQVIGYSFSF